MSADDAPAVGFGRSADALLLDATLESIPYGFCVWSPEFTLVLWNRHYLDIYGFPSSRIKKGMTLEAVVRLSARLGNHPDQQPEEFLASYKSALLDNRGGARAKVRELVAGGRWLETAHAYSPGLGWVVTHEDVTEEIEASNLAQRRKQEVERQNLRLDAAVNNISQGLCMHDSKGALVISNAPFQRIYGLPDDLVQPGTHLEDILKFMFARGLQAGGGHRDFETWRRELVETGRQAKNVRQYEGRSILVQEHPMGDGGVVYTHEDITEQRLQEERIRHLARYDLLTELPNRAEFLAEMSAAESSITRGEHLAVLYIDLDHFKNVNDTLGHQIGDRLLQQVAARLWGTTREDDVLARVGGDEFALLLRGFDRPADAATVAERIVSVMASPFAIDGNQIVIGASVGIALAPQDGMTGNALMKNADLALYKAKTEGRSTYHFFELAMDAAIQKRRAIEAGLRLALGRGELRLAFQPLVSLKENRVACCEALLRWTDPEGNIVPPAEFIPVAEETGLILPIGEWVLREACRTATTWPEHIRVAVNLSAVQFKSKRLFETVEEALRDTGLDATRLELEITESLLLADNEQTLAVLHKLRAMGAHISMDDFGTGYSSLSYLRSFPFDKIKIDRSFMRDLNAMGDSATIVKAVIGLGQALGMSTTAEGIETEEQLAAVRAYGCNEVQGFLFAPPLAPADLEDLLRAEQEFRRAS